MTGLRIARSIAGLREAVGDWRRAGLSVGMVPTMGALHAGHASLVAAAEEQCDRVVATLFVNPTQFAPSEDLSAYPRDETADRQLLTELGADLLFAPSVDEIYPEGFDTRIVVGGPSAGLESAFRPHFFAGVATVVGKLLLAGLPDRAFFGEKDYQQLLVVKQMVRDLGIPTAIVGCPTMREPDGLALSSRNAYLSAAERRQAPKLHAAMQATSRRIQEGMPIESALEAGKAELADAGFAVDYLEARNAETLAPLARGSGEPIRLLTAAKLGRTRLIDNIAVSTLPTSPG